MELLAQTVVSGLLIGFLYALIAVGLTILVQRLLRTAPDER